MTDRQALITLNIELPANRDYLGTLRVLNASGVVLAGPYRIAARASDEIAAEHGNPTRATMLPYGDPPLGSYGFQGLAKTGEGTRYRRDLFGTLDVIILAGTGGHAALADANGRFEIMIHGGPLAASGGLRASTGHFRISDPDLAAVSDLIRRAEAGSCTCEQAPVHLGVEVVSDLPVASDPSVNRRPTLQRKPRPTVAPDCLVAFGEYTDTTLIAPDMPQPGLQGAACMGMETICQNIQYTAALSQDSDIVPYTGAPNAISPLLTDPYGGGPSPMFPNGQPLNAFSAGQQGISYRGGPGPGRATGAVGAPSSGGQPTNAPGGQTGQSNAGGQDYDASTALSLLVNAGRGAYGGQPIASAGGAGAWSWSRPSDAAQAAIQEQVRMGFRNPPGANVATATAQSGQARALPKGWPTGTWDPDVAQGYWPSRSIATSIRSQTAEITGFQARLAIQGEIPILAPAGSNIPGPDYATAARLPSGDYGIILPDMKSRVTLNAFGQVPGTLPPSWQTAVGNAVAPGTLDLGDPAVEQAIRDAFAQGRITIVRDTVDFSVQGQGAMQLNNLAIPIDAPIAEPPSGAPGFLGPGLAEVAGLATVPLAGGLEENPNVATVSAVVALAAFAFPEVAATVFATAVAGAIIVDVFEDLMTAWRDFSVQQINESMRSFQGPY